MQTKIPSETDSNPHKKLKRVHILGQYSKVHEFACVYLNMKTNQLSKGALYRKMMQYW